MKGDIDVIRALQREGYDKAQIEYLTAERESCMQGAVSTHWWPFGQRKWAYWHTAKNVKATKRP